MTAGHVRVLAALVAAITLHALLLSWPLPASKNILINNGPLHIDLLKATKQAAAQRHDAEASSLAHAQIKQQHRALAHANKQSKQKLSHKQKTPATRVQKNSPPRMVSPSTIQPTTIAHQQTHTMPQAVQGESAHQTTPLPVRSGKAATTHQPPLVSAGAQTMLLANIRYPSQARRRGWQGRGEFQLAIVSQGIRNITILASTGHAILDRAVQRGLAGIEHIPLADGQYRLPVEFYLK